MTVSSIAPRTAKETGQPFYLAPSRTVPGQAHRCTAYGCTCKDFERYGRCAHTRAVQLHEAHERDIEQAFAEVARRARSAATFERLLGSDDD